MALSIDHLVLGSFPQLVVPYTLVALMGAWWFVLWLFRGFGASATALRVFTFCRGTLALAASRVNPNVLGKSCPVEWSCALSISWELLGAAGLLAGCLDVTWLRPACILGAS